jgi:hypothetical protein
VQTPRRRQQENNSSRPSTPALRRSTDLEGMVPVAQAGKIAVLDFVGLRFLQAVLGTPVRNRVESSTRVLQVVNQFVQEDRAREGIGADVQAVVDEHALRRVIECHNPTRAGAETLLDLLMRDHMDLGQDLRGRVSGKQLDARE